MAKINNGPPKQPLWPWGGPRGVRERLVDPSQLDRKRQAKKAGDPKNPALPSGELMDSIGYARGADDTRLPEPPLPPGHQADITGFLDAPHLAMIAEKYEAGEGLALARELPTVSASPERRARMEALLEREREALSLIQRHTAEVEQIRARMYEEQKSEGF